MKSIMQDEKKCYVTKKKPSEYVVLHKHHIYGGNPNRDISEENGFWVWLIPEYHNMSDEGVHFNEEFDTALKQECQLKYEETHTREEFMALIGRSYL